MGIGRYNNVTDCVYVFECVRPFDSFVLFASLIKFHLYFDRQLRRKIGIILT